MTEIRPYGIGGGMSATGGNWPDLPDDPEVYKGRHRLSHGPPEYDAMRERIVPMISAALKRTPLLGLDIIGWDYFSIPTPNAILIGVGMAVRGYDLAGPGRELAQFRNFGTWKPSQTEVDQIVGALIDGLREARSAQGRTVNGQP